MNARIVFSFIVVSCLTLMSCTTNDASRIALQPSATDSFDSSNGSRVLFVSNQTGNREIYSVNLDGSDLVQLTNSSGDDYDPSWSPDGNRIVFSSNRETGQSQVFLMNADGSEQRNISQSNGSDGRAKWSPDGQTIVFNATRNGTDLLSLYSLRDSQIVALETPDVFATSAPNWSPDGQWIAFQGYTTASKSDVWLVKADGSHVRQLTNDPKTTDSNISWSPNGKSLIYHSRRQREYNIYRFDLDTNRETQLTYLPTSDSEPQWSKDGKKILFLSTRGQFGRTQVCTMQEDGTQQECYTDERYQTGDAVWLADGNGILHSNWVGSRYSNVYLLNVEDKSLTALSPAKGYQSQPTPSPKVLPNISQSHLAGLYGERDVRRQ